MREILLQISQQRRQLYNCRRVVEITLLFSGVVQTNKQNNKILLITNISNYISFPPQIAYKLIEAGKSKNSLQIQGLSIDGLNNRENTTIQYIEQTNIEQKQIY